MKNTAEQKRELILDEIRSYFGWSKIAVEISEHIEDLDALCGETRENFVAHEIGRTYAHIDIELGAAL